MYIFSGVLFTVIAAVLLHVFTGGYVVMNGIAYSLGGNIFTTYYISLSIFLAYAVTYPDLQLLLMFVIPIRMKWMAFVHCVGYRILSSSRALGRCSTDRSITFKLCDLLF